MGTEIYLVNDKRRTFYELGKGAWIELQDRLDTIVQGRADSLFSTIFVRILDGNEEDDDSEQEIIREYASLITDDLIKMNQGDDVRDLRLIYDCNPAPNHLPPKGYRCVGTRYWRGENSAANEECIQAIQKAVDEWESPPEPAPWWERLE